MKNFKFIYLLLVAVGAMAFTACDNNDWTPGEYDQNMGVYFADTSAIVVTAEDTQATIAVKRLVANADASILVRSQEVTEAGVSGFFTVAESVNFAAGSDEASLKITFDGKKLTPGEQYKIVLQLDQNEASKYGISEATFSIGIAEPWNVIGTGLYRDDFLGPMYGSGAGAVIEVPIAQHGLEPTRFRMIEPFSPTNCANIIGGVPGDMTYTTPGYVEFIIDPATGNVEIPSSWLGFKLDVKTGDGPVDFYLASVYADENTPMYGYYDEAKGLITFAPQSIMWHIPDGRGNYANQSGLFAVVMPGFSLNDYSISSAYAGIIIEADNETASAVIDFTFGADVESYRFTIVEGAVLDATETVDGIVNDSLGEDVLIYEAPVSESTWKFEMETGIYTVVAVPYGNGEAQVDEASSTRFYFPACATEVPNGDFIVALDSVAALTGNADYDAQFPADYKAALLIEGNAVEIMGLNVWLGDTSSVEGTTLTEQQIVDNYGSDFSPYIANIVANGYVIAGPWDFMSGSSATAIVAIRTVYGKTQYYRVDHAMPYSGELTLGDYVLTEGKNELLVTLTGGYEAGTCFMHMTGFDGTPFFGAVDTEKKTLTFNGMFDGQNEPLFGELYGYYNDEGTQAYGYFSSVNKDFSSVDNMVVTLDENNAPATLSTYFGCLVFNLDDGSPVGTAFAFSPEATFVAAPAEEAPETPETPETPEQAAVKSARKATLVPELNAGLRYSNAKAEKYEGKLPVREYKHNAQVR